MSKWQKVMCITVIFISGLIIGSKAEYHHQHFNRKDIVIKNIEQVNRIADYKNVSVDADMTFFWIDTHSKRDDFNDERVCMGTKLHLALMESVKYCESEGIELTASKAIYFYTCLVKYFYEHKGPFHEGRDWLSFNIKAITFPTEDGQSVTIEFGDGDIVNPYYKENPYFKEK